MKTISVILTSYNYAHYLHTSISALLKQTLPPLEIILIDDASTDNSVEIIREFQKKTSLIHFIQNEKNLGIIETTNRGIDLANGDFIALYAADDEMLPNFLEESMALLNLYPEAGICSSKFTVFFDHAPNQLASFSTLLSSKKTFTAPKKFLQKAKFKDLHLGGQNTIYKLSALREAGKLSAELGHMCDWFVISVLAFRYGACFIPETLTKMRIHQKAYSQVKQKDTEYSKKLFQSVLQKLEQKEFSDIREAFINSGILYHVVPSIRVLLSKQNRKYIRLSLVWHLSIVACKKLKNWITRFFKNV